MCDRYFPSRAMGGRLYFDGSGTLRRSGGDMWVERVGHRKVCTEVELLGESARGLPAIRVWVRKGLEGVARRLSA
jgi:hypothetical protein